MKILAIGAHFDDVELGCGGALARHARDGDEVNIYVATVSGFTNYQNRVVRADSVARKEGEAAMKILGAHSLQCGKFRTLHVEFVDALNKEIVQIVEERKIDLVYAHWSGDVHHDHRAVSLASMHSCRHVPRVLMYRSNWYHAPCVFQGNFYVDISQTWSHKRRAILAHESEVERTGRRWVDFFQNEAVNAGQRIGVKYAEVFEVVKWLR